MKKATVIFFFILLGALALSCGSVEPGTDCETNGDCDDGQQCVPIAFGCVDSKSCASTCEVTCVTNDDCSGGDSCENRNGHLICQSKEPPRPWE